MLCILHILYILVPDEKANVTFIYKCKKKDLGNYRAVSLISGSRKIMEWIFLTPMFRGSKKSWKPDSGDNFNLQNRDSNLS